MCKYLSDKPNILQSIPHTLAVYYFKSRPYQVQFREIHTQKPPHILRQFGPTVRCPFWFGANFLDVLLTERGEDMNTLIGLAVPGSPVSCLLPSSAVPWQLQPSLEKACSTAPNRTLAIGALPSRTIGPQELVLLQEPWLTTENELN